MSLLIQGGCTFLGENIWEYRYTNKTGMYSIQFIALQTPKIGDTIDNGALVPKTGPIINQDTSKWEVENKDTWPSKKF